MAFRKARAKWFFAIARSFNFSGCHLLKSGSASVVMNVSRVTSDYSAFLPLQKHVLWCGPRFRGASRQRHETLHICSSLTFVRFRFYRACRNRSRRKMWILLSNQLVKAIKNTPFSRISTLWSSYVHPKLPTEPKLSSLSLRGPHFEWHTKEGGTLNDFFDLTKLICLSYCSEIVRILAAMVTTVWHL